MKAATQCFLAVLLIAALLVACGGPDIGVTSEEIVLGTWTPLTGPASHLSVMAKAMEAYFSYVNDEGGIHGRSVRLIIKDDGYDPARTPEVVRELVEEDSVFAIVGGNGTANCLAVKDYLARRLIPWINPGSGSRVWTTPTQAYIFSIQPSYVTEARILARYAVENLESETIGLFYQDDSFGAEGQEGVRLGLREVDQELAVSVTYQVGEQDFAAKAQAFKDAGVDAVMIWTIPEGAAGLAKAFADMEEPPALLASQILSDPVMFDLAGEAWEGAIVASIVPDPELDAPHVVQARDILSQYGSDVPFGSFALMGMSRAQLAAEGMRRAGPELTRVKLVFSLEGIDNWEDNFLGRPISFGEDDHQGMSAVWLMRAEQGEFVHVTEWLE